MNQTQEERIAAEVVRLLAPLLHQTPRPEPTDALLTIDEVAARLQIGRRTAERLVSGGQLLAIRVGRQRRFTAAAVDAYLRTCTARPRRRRRPKATPGSTPHTPGAARPGEGRADA